MATRFYLSNGGTAAVSPAYSATWEVSTDADRKPLVRKLLLSATDALADKTINIPNLTSQDILSRQFVSEPLPPQVITGTVSLVISATESGVTSNGTLAVAVTLVSQDGATVRGVMFSVFGTDTEYATTASTRIVNAQALTQQTAQTGDRIVVEIGTTATTPALTTNTHRYGTSAATDFALTSALTTDLNPWIEFSQNLFPALSNNYQFVKVGNGMSSTERIR